MEPENIHYDIYIHWELVRECNFNCEYCYANPVAGRPGPADIPRIIERLDKFNRPLLITFAGGEPFLLPNFTELVREVTKKHYVRVDTNLSIKAACEKFMDTIDPSRVVEMTFSVHAGERERLNMPLSDLAGRVKQFQAKGFRLIGNYVAYPPLLEKMKQIAGFFKDEGIEVLPTVFSGTFDGKKYPINKGLSSYREKELELIGGMSRYATTVMCKTKGETCQAGSAAFFVNHKYEVFPCTMIHKRIGDFFEEWNAFPKVIKCPVDYCFCPFNRPLAASANIFRRANVELLDKAVKEKGTASYLQSFLWSATAVLLFRKIGAIIFDFFGLPKRIRMFKKK